jgi:hypothetical protein
MILLVQDNDEGDAPKPASQCFVFCLVQEVWQRRRVWLVLQADVDQGVLFPRRAKDK